MDTLTLKIEKRKLTDLKPAEYNPRQASKDQQEKLQDSLKKFGCVEPIIVNENPDRFNIIVGGHFRVRELIKLGQKEVDCVIVNLSLEEEKELNIRLNANTGDWDIDILANNFDVEELEDWGLEIKGFEDINIDNDDEEDLENCNVKKELLKCPACGHINEKKAFVNYEDTK